MPVGTVVHRARQAHRQRKRAFVLQHQVGKHVAHQGLLVQHPAEGRTDRAVVQRLRHRCALAGRGTDHAIEARHRHHLDDGANATTFLAHHPRQRAAQLGLARRVRDVAHLALQSQHLHRVLAAVGPPTRQQEARQPAGRLRQHQERIAHRRRDEILVADELVGSARTLGVHRVRTGGVGAHVRAALLFGHRHADRQALLGRIRHVARIVDARGDPRLPELREFGRRAQ